MLPLWHNPRATHVRQSLKTADLREANARAKALHAQWSQQFERLRRRHNPQPVELTPALGQAIAAELGRWVLQADDNLRSFPEGPRALLLREARQAVDAAPEALKQALPAATFSQALTIGHQAQQPASLFSPAIDPLAGLSPAEHGAVARWNAAASASAAIDSARRNLRGVLPLADEVARNMGLAVDWSTQEGRDALALCLAALKAAADDTVRRDGGDWIDTPAYAPVQQPAGANEQKAKGHTAQDAYEVWRAAKPGRPKKTLQTYEAAADKLARLIDNRPLEMLTRADGRDIVAALLQEAQDKGKRTAQNTAATQLSRFKTLLEHAKDVEWIGSNVLEGREIPRVQSSRGSWSDEDLCLLFADPIFTAYALPEEWQAGADAAYWLPLLGLYTGARISELAQLHTTDIYEEPRAGWVLSIKEDQAEGQRVKNEHSIRRVPIHAELIRLGLLDYWRAIKQHGEGPLWPAIVRCPLNGAGGNVSKWFGKFKKAKGIGAATVFHSFRHTLQTRLLALGAPDAHVDTLAGHSGKTTGRRVYTHLEPEHVRPTLERLAFPEVHLPRVFTSLRQKRNSGSTSSR